MIEHLTMALWATNMGCAPAGREEFVQLVADRLEAAREQGAGLLLLPEYVCEAWLTWAPPDLAETAEIAWMAEEARAILPRLRRLAIESGVALLAGTFPAREGEGWRNRAFLFLPDGRTVEQDKLSLTPDEKDPTAWSLEPGSEVRVAEWNGLRLATVICLDIEQPALGALLQPLDLDLVLVPSDTGRLSGYSRVFACARARAVELFCAVASVGGVGAIPVPPPRPNVSAAAVYLPCEEAFGFTGVAGELPPAAEADGAGEMLIVHDVPLGEIRRRRQSRGEVWPGPWSAGHLRVVDEAGVPVEA
ncbi:nitrilase-related carbon-nitrogen hydrolase [Geminicoccaceae bacterium 1502E]|nr:nitrilase-related carbon-nitrogen hydrolase [Geminicoccaceae bacterium 1502E]